MQAGSLPVLAICGLQVWAILLEGLHPAAEPGLPSGVRTQLPPAHDQIEQIPH